MSTSGYPETPLVKKLYQLLLMVSNLLGRQVEVKLHTGQEAKLGMFMLSTLTAWKKN
jgi:hypothetical protein